MKISHDEMCKIIRDSFTKRSYATAFECPIVVRVLQCKDGNFAVKLDTPKVEK